MSKNYFATKKVASKLLRGLHIVIMPLLKMFVVISKHLHHHTAHKPHSYLMKKNRHYHKWHMWERHGHVHYSVLTVYCTAVATVLLLSYAKVIAASDLIDVWDFSSQPDYTLDQGVEFNGNSIRLKPQEYVNDANTAALYHFNETSGSSFIDSSSQGNDGTTASSPSWTTGNMNNALSLNGSTQYASIPDSASLSLGSQQTVEGWIKPSAALNNSTSSNQTIFDKGSSKLYFDNTTSKLAYEIQNGTTPSWARVADTRGQNGSWNSEAYYIDSQLMYGGDLYVGTSYIAGSADVWKRSGSTWTKIGGDGVNGSWNGMTYEGVYSMVTIGTNLYAGLGSGPGDAEVWRCSLASNCTSWTKIGGDGMGLVSSQNSVRALINHQGTLYAGIGDDTSAGDADGDVWRYDGGTSWTKIGGDGINSGWPASSIERVQSLSSDGTNLYAGLSNSTGDAEVWRWNGTSWTKIGGDAVNSSWADSTYEYVYSLENDGTNLYAGLGFNGAEAEVWRWNGTSWTQIGGDTIGNSFGGTAAIVSSMVYDQSTSKLYAGVQTNYGAHEWVLDGSNWTLIGGSGIDESWSNYAMGTVQSMTTNKGKQYIGLGTSVSTAIVYEFDGSNYRMIGGDGVNSSWPYGNDGTYEVVQSLASYNGEVYAGLGLNNGDGEVWKYDGSSWTKVGGDGVNSSWSSAQYITSMTSWNGKLYATTYGAGANGYIYEWNGTSWINRGGGTGNINGITSGSYSGAASLTPYRDKLCMGFANSVNQADVWCWGGSGNWSQVGGDGLNSSWNSLDTGIWSMAMYDGKLIAGVSDDTNRDPAIWSYNGSSWTKIAGANVNGSWGDSNYYRTLSFSVYNGELYTGLGFGANNGHVWKYDGSSWTQVGGDGLNNSWGSTIEGVYSMGAYKGKLYAGLGSSNAADAQIYSFGNNAYVESSSTNFNTNWKHIAATYDGTTAKIYIDGAQDASKNVAVSPVDNSLSLLFGASYGGSIGGSENFNGQLDEFRISNNARTSFTTKPYSTTTQSVTLNDPVRKNGVKQWDNLAASESPNGGSINYRLSSDEGATWKYWNGSNWSTSSNTSQSNPIGVIDANISSFPAGFGGIKWQALLNSDGTQRVQLNSVTLSSTSDTSEPDTNASDITALKADGGASLSNNDWTNGPSPYFSWTVGSDSDSGILGYCLYLGNTPSADPETTKGLLGNSPLDTDGSCQFAISGTSINLAHPGYLETALTTSNTPYYLNIKAIDKAGNIFGSSEQFQFRFDNTPPTNPGFISAPSSFINTKTATLTWPTSGGQSASDANSGVAGLQYKIGNTLWYGDNHTGTGDSGDLLADDGSYTTVDPPDFDNINDGINTISFRTWDQAGNVTSTYVTAALKVNTSGAPSEPLNLEVTPATNTVNSFTFSWDPPDTFNTTSGQASGLSYCYTINTLPTISNCTYTSPGITSVGPGSFATQPGANTFYVVAKDDFNAINYSSFASATFTANTPAPGIPLNTDIVDVSIKATNNWRLAITWDQPSSVGAGIASYKVYRSIAPSGTYSLVGSSSSTTYIDSGLSQQTYYYKIRACDSANNCGAESTIVSKLPTGKFTSPAVITSEPEVSNITTKRATIKWSTDRASDSKIALGTSSGSYSPSEIGNSEQTTAHTIDLNNLAAGTTYYYVAKWTDEDGNTGTSQEYTFKTSPAPSLKEVSVEKIGLSSATIQFTSKDAHKVDIMYGASQSFGGITSINTSPNESLYATTIDGLSDGTKYLFKLVTYDKEGNKYDSSIYSFVTPARPKISNLRFQPVAGEPTSTQQVTWNTNVPATSSVIYSRVNGDTKDAQSLELKTDHSLIIKDLQDDSDYTLVAESRDGNGNLATSDSQVFRTALDTRPPKVFDVSIESMIRGVGSEARGQVVVSWKTDEPATSQVGYAEGSSATVFNNRTAEDNDLSTEHVVIVSDLPTSRVYSIQPISRDRSNNQGTSEAQSAIIGRASDDILTIVFNTLRRVFGY